MNFLDIIGIIILTVITLGTLFVQFELVKDGEGIKGILSPFCVWLIIAGGLFMVFFFSFDTRSGSTIGTVTSIDRKTFGQAYSIYIKTTETKEEKYCAEDPKVIEQARELIGKKIKITYGTRVGIYSTGRCNEAPIETIEEVK